MKKQMIKFAVIIFSAAVLFFAANTLFCTSKGIAPEIKDITDIKILELRSDSLTLNINVIALNENDSDIEIYDICLSLIIDSDTIGSAYRNEKVRLKKFDTSTVSLSAILNTPKVIDFASVNKNTAKLKFIGDLTADLGLFKLPVGVELEHKFDIQRKITETVESDTRKNKLIKVEAAKLKSVGLDNSTVEIEFAINNPYGVDFLLKDYPSQIYINENKSGDGNIESEILLEKEAMIVKGSIVYMLSNLETISSLLGSVIKRKLNYQTSGTLHLEVLGYNIKFPFNFKGELINI
jgi:LEA14-like dessication related protein